MKVKSISTRFLLTLVISVVMTFSFFRYLLQVSEQAEMLSQINTAGQEVMMRLSTVVSVLYSKEYRRSSMARFFQNELKSNSCVQSITLRDANRELILRIQRDENWTPIEVKAEPPFSYDPHIVNILKEDTFSSEEKTGTLEIVLSDKIVRKQQIQHIRNFFTSLFLTVVFSSIIVFILLQLSVVQPLKTLIQFVQQYKQSGGKTVTLVPSEHFDEVGLLIQEFNDLMIELTKSLNQKASLIHQLELGNDEMQREIKERIYAEERERSAQRYMNTVFNVVPAMIAVVDEELVVTELNTAMQEFTGLGAECTKIPLSDILPFVENLAEPMYQALKDRRSHIFQCSDNSEPPKYYAITLNPFVYGKDVRGIIRLDDITKQFLKQEELFGNLQLENAGKLTDSITHDFNNLLGGIMGSVFLAKMEIDILPGEHTELKNLLNAIETASKRSGDLMKKLSSISISNWKNDHMVEVDLIIVLDNVLSILSSSVPPEIKVEFCSHLSGKKALISGNPRQLEQIFLNLILNGIRAMTVLRENGNSWGGILRLELIKEFNEEKGSDYCVEIHDTGIGIESKRLKELLDPFYVGKNSGAHYALGLTICKNLVKRHNGWISADSEPGKGSVFSVHLPISDEYAAQKEVSELPVIRGLETILVIDDNEMMLKVASQMLNRCGYQVLSANNGIEGIELFRKNPQIALVLLDLFMPHLSGQEIFAAVKELRPDISVIFMSGANEGTQLIKMGNYDGFLMKPYSIGELSEKILEVLGNAKKTTD